MEEIKEKVDKSIINESTKLEIFNVVYKFSSCIFTYLDGIEYLVKYTAFLQALSFLMTIAVLLICIFK